MNGHLVARFAAIYAGLALVVIAAGLGAYAFYGTHTVEQRVAHVEAALGDQNLARLADKYLGDQAAAHGYAISKITVTRIVTQGDDADVHATVTLTDGVSTATQKIVVVFRRNIWQAQVIKAGP